MIAAPRMRCVEGRLRKTLRLEEELGVEEAIAGTDSLWKLLGEADIREGAYMWGYTLLD